MKKLTKKQIDKFAKRMAKEQIRFLQAIYLEEGMEDMLFHALEKALGEDCPECYSYKIHCEVARKSFEILKKGLK